MIMKQAQTNDHWWFDHYWQFKKKIIIDLETMQYICYSPYLK